MPSNLLDYPEKFPDLINEARFLMQTPDDVTTELLKAKSVSRMLGLSPSTVRRLSEAGAIPSPIKVGSSVLWRRSDLTSWIEAGSPDRITWNAIVAASKKAVRK